MFFLLKLFSKPWVKNKTHIAAFFYNLAVTYKICELFKNSWKWNFLFLLLLLLLSTDEFYCPSLLLALCGKFRKRNKDSNAVLLTAMCVYVCMCVCVCESVLYVTVCVFVCVCVSLSLCVFIHVMFPSHTVQVYKLFELCILIMLKNFYFSLAYDYLNTLTR